STTAIAPYSAPQLFKLPPAFLIPLSSTTARQEFAIQAERTTPQHLEPNREQFRRFPAGLFYAWSGRPDLNRGPHAPQACALPGCATPRLSKKPRRKRGKRVRRDSFKAITCVRAGSRKRATNPANPTASFDSKAA